MSVSLVKSYFTAGFNLPGCLPENGAALFATLDDARAYLADELERAADETFDRELDNARDDYASEDEYNANFSEAHGDSASISGSAELVKSDRDGDIAWSVERYDGWTTVEPDGYSYWIHKSTLGSVFGDDNDSEEYLDVVDAILGR